MVVPVDSQNGVRRYTWDNITREFSYPYIIQSDSLFANLYDSDGTLILAIPATSYELSDPIRSTGILTITDDNVLNTQADIIILERIETLDQELDLGKGDFPPQDVEDAFDKSRIIDQQQQALTNRGVITNITEGREEPIQLPVSDSGKSLVWDDDGNIINSQSNLDELSEETKGYRDEAEGFRDESEVFRNEAETAAEVAVAAADSVSNAPYAILTGDGIETSYDLTSRGFTSIDVEAYQVFVDSNPMRPNVDFEIIEETNGDITLIFINFAPQARIDNIQVYGRNSTYIGTSAQVNSVNGETGDVVLTANDIVQDAIIGAENVEDALEVIKDTFNNLTYLESVQEGNNITIDNTDAQNPIINMNEEFLKDVTVSGTRLSISGNSTNKNIDIADIANLAIESFDTITVSDDNDNPSFITGMQLSGDSNGFTLTDATTGTIQNISGRELKLLGSVEMHPDKTGGGTEALRLFSEISVDGTNWVVNPNSLRITEVDGNSESYISYCSDIVFPIGSYVRFRLFCSANDEVDITSLQETVLNGQTVICPSFKWRLGEID